MKQSVYWLSCATNDLVPYDVGFFIHCILHNFRLREKATQPCRAQRFLSDCSVQLSYSMQMTRDCWDKAKLMLLSPLFKSGKDFTKLCKTKNNSCERWNTKQWYLTNARFAYLCSNNAISTVELWSIHVHGASLALRTACLPACISHKNQQ